MFVLQHLIKSKIYSSKVDIEVTIISVLPPPPANWSSSMVVAVARGRRAGGVSAGRRLGWRYWTISIWKCGRYISTLLRLLSQSPCSWERCKTCKDQNQKEHHFCTTHECVNSQGIHVFGTKKDRWWIVRELSTFMGLVETGCEGRLYSLQIHILR